ncbi:uncharacterized protein OCT59_010551 [Rhizophagus irregularis]|uniref:uncharacterized protein n=1 Tax=Rhizophagus irregularis TaxID=588596 RepID=UPI00332D674A|nr:hypothetical protein OCT59_010551 [Rhizophagus irregularis]
MQKFDSTCKDVEYRIAIDLLDNLIPPILDVYAILFRSGSFEKYVETYSSIQQWMRHLPTAYSTSHPPQLGLCDYCKLQMNDDSVVLVCGHGYHSACYVFIVKIFIKTDDLDDEIIEDEEEGTEETECEQTDISVALALAINNINYW